MTTTPAATPTVAISPIQNDQLVLVVGESGSGKSASLRNIKKPDGVIYANCETNKKLPFPAKFKQYSVTDPYQLYTAFTVNEPKPNIHTIIVDTLTFLMDMFESVHVIPAPNGMKAWGDYAQYFKNLMQQYVAKSTKNVIFTAHTQSILNDQDMTLEKKVPIKGTLKGNGVEAFFSTVIAAKVMPVIKLKDYVNPLLIITPEEEALGFKYVFQTKLTKDTVHERIRAPMGLFSTSETFIDNDVEHVLNKLSNYYK